MGDEFVEHDDEAGVAPGHAVEGEQLGAEGVEIIEQALLLVPFQVPADEVQGLLFTEVVENLDVEEVVEGFPRW